MFWKIIIGPIPLNVDLMKETNRKSSNRLFKSAFCWIPKMVHATMMQKKPNKYLDKK